MALSSDTAAQLSPEQIQLVGTIEEEIDDWLSRKYSGAKEAGGSFFFSSAGRLASEKVIQELSDRYRKAGWGRVEITYDINDSGGLSVEVKFAK